MSEAVELGKQALEICKREVRGFDERGASLQTDIHAAVLSALRANHGEAEPVAWLIENTMTGVSPIATADPKRAKTFGGRPLYTRPVACPEGYKLVPVEPTEAMLEAARENDAALQEQGFNGAEVEGVWAVMLAAVNEN